LDQYYQSLTKLEYLHLTIRDNEGLRFEERFYIEFYLIIDSQLLIEFILNHLMDFHYINV
jgi:hypothetical protein